VRAASPLKSALHLPIVWNFKKSDSTPDMDFLERIGRENVMENIDAALQRARKILML
jgi:hypothetical protein